MGSSDPPAPQRQPGNATQLATSPEAESQAYQDMKLTNRESKNKLL